MNEEDRACLELTEEDFICAMKEMNTVIDVAIEDLVDLYRLARKYADIREAESVPITDIMTHDVVTTSPSSSLAEAARTFLLNHIRGMPVVDDKGRAVGMITEADVLAALGLPCHHPACSLLHKLGRIFSEAHHIRGLTGKVEEAMCRDLVTATVTDSLHNVIEKMKKRRVKSVIVTDDTNHVRGILTRSDIVKAFVDRPIEK